MMFTIEIECRVSHSCILFNNKKICYSHNEQSPFGSWLLTMPCVNAMRDCFVLISCYLPSLRLCLQLPRPPVHLSYCRQLKSLLIHYVQPCLLSSHHRRPHRHRQHNRMSESAMVNFQFRRSTFDNVMCNYLFRPVCVCAR